MSSTPRRRAARIAILAASALLALPSAAFAAGGSGGGGGGGGGAGGGGGTVAKPGTVKVGSSDVAVCDNGTELSLSIGKGRGKTIEEVLVMSGNTGGFWMFRTVEVVSGRNVVGFGGNRSELGAASSVTTVQVNSWLPKGTWELAFSGTRTELLPGAPLDATGRLLETCTGSLTVVVG